MRAGFKTTLGCVIVTLVVMAIHVPHEAWSLITVFVLSAPEVGASFQKGALRLLGTLIGAGVAVMMIDLFSQYPASFSLVLFAVSMYASYRATGTQYPYAHLIGLVTLLIVGVQALDHPSDAEWIAMARCAEVMLGVIATILVTLSIWPVRATDKLHDALAATIDDCRALLAAGRDTEDGPMITRLLDARQQHQALLQLARNERDVSGKRFERLSRAVVLADHVVDATLAADAIHRFAGLPDPELPGEPGAAPRSLLNELEALAGALRRTPSGMSSKREVAPGPPSSKEGRENAGGRYGDAAMTAGTASLARHVDALGRRVPTLGPRPPAEATARADDLPHGLASATRWTIDRVRLIHAFNVALSLQIALWIWAIFHLPAGMQAMVTVLLVSQKTLGASQLKTSLRLAGAFVGGGIGILVAAFIIPLISSLAALILVITPVLFLCAWLNDGSKRYGYAGFQAGFAFILTLIGGPSPMPDPMAPVLRFTGILIGATVALTVMRSIAPVDAWGGSRAAIAALLEQSGRRLRVLLDGLPAADAEWGTSIATLRDRASVHLGELRDGGRQSRWRSQQLEPLMHLASRFAAVVATLAEDAGEADARAAIRPELAELGRAVEDACGRLAATVRARARAHRDEAPERALARLEAQASGQTATAPLTVERVAILLGRLRACVALLEALATRTWSEAGTLEPVRVLAPSRL